MFREKDMTQALKWLMGLYSKEDCLGIDISDLLEFADCDFHEVCQGLRNNVEMVYEYNVSGDLDRSIEYRGKELFSQRAIQIAVAPMYEEENGIFHVSHIKELWLLEDMTFSIVNCLHFFCEYDNCQIETEYRTVSKKFEERDDIFIAPDVLIEELMAVCIPVWEDEATIYEL